MGALLYFSLTLPAVLYATQNRYKHDAIGRGSHGRARPACREERRFRRGFQVVM